MCIAGYIREEKKFNSLGKKSELYPLLFVSTVTINFVFVNFLFAYFIIIIYVCLFLLKTFLVPLRFLLIPSTEWCSSSCHQMSS